MLCGYSVSFQSAVRMESKDTFWLGFGKALQRSIKRSARLPPIESVKDFANLFASENQEKIFGGRPVVLLIDEFDLISSAPEPLLDEVLNILRDMKQKPDEYCMRSVVALDPSASFS
jgi:hypothetical protein